MPRVPPPAAAVAAALIQHALAGEMHPPSRARTVGALALSLASMSMVGAAASRFHHSDTTLDPFQPDRASVLVTDGANAISRNPMYAGLAGVLLAHTVWRGSWTAVLPVVGFVAFMDRAQIRAEESALLTTFGTAYRNYQARTPRWIDRRSLRFARPATHG